MGTKSKPKGAKAGRKLAQAAVRSRKAKAARASKKQAKKQPGTVMGDESGLARANKAAKKGPQFFGRAGAKKAAKAADKAKRAEARKNRKPGKYAATYAERKALPWYAEYRATYDKGYYMIRDGTKAKDMKMVAEGARLVEKGKKIRRDAMAAAKAGKPAKAAKPTKPKAVKAAAKRKGPKAATGPKSVGTLGLPKPKKSRKAASAIQDAGQPVEQAQTDLDTETEQIQEIEGELQGGDERTDAETHDDEGSGDASGAL